MNFQSVIEKVKLITVEPILFLYMMVTFMESNALQELIYIKSCITLKNPVNISDCSYELKANQTDATNLATEWYKYTNTCLFLFTFISTFYVGSWSDRLGHKLPMLIPPIGTVIAACINAVLSYFIKVHMAYFFISAFISGITFGSVGIIATSFGYISYFTLEQSRTKRIVILESMIFIGGTAGIKIAGLFLKHVHYEQELNNFVMLYIFEAIICTAITVYIIFRIPSYSLQEPMSCSSLFSLRHVGDSLRTIFCSREEGKRTKIILILITLCLIYMGNVVEFTLGYYFLRTIKWNFDEYTNLFSVQFAVEAIALLCIFPLLHRFPWVPDHCIGMMGLFSRFAGFTVFGLSALTTYSDYMVYSCILLFIFSQFPVPALRSILSKTVDSDEKGRIFAFTTVLQNLCFLLGSFVLMTLFTESSFKGLSFEVAAGMQGMAFFILLYLYLTSRSCNTAYEAI